jgi:pyochelin synthetase
MDTNARRERIERLRAQLSPQQQARVDRVLDGSVSSASPPTARAPTATPDPARRNEPFPLTELQEAYWVGRSAGMTLGNTACFIYFETERAGLDLRRLKEALRRLIQRHDMLRMIILRDGRQQILRDVPPYEIAVRDRRGAPDQDEQLRRIREELSHQVLPTDRWPLFSVTATLLDEERVRLHVGFDTLVGDAWGLRLALAELQQLYEDPGTELPPLSFSFRDYVLAEIADRQGEGYTRALAHWRDRLPELPPAPELPLKRPAEEIVRPRFVRRFVRMPKEPWDRLRAHAAGHGLTATQALLAAWVEVLGRFSASPRFTLNIPLFNRLPLHPEVERIVGEFASFTLVSTDGDLRGPFCTRASRIKAQLVQGLDHSRVHGVRLLRELSRVRGRRELMPVVFTSILSLEGLAPPTVSAGSLGEVLYEITQTPQVWLDVQVFEDGGALRVQLDAVDDLFEDGVLDAMHQALSKLLSTLAEDPGAWERDRLDVVEAPPATPMLPGADRLHLAHQGLCAQAESQAGAPAVIARDRAVSYGEVHTGALRIAAKLRERGAGPGARVAVVMEKGWEQFVAVLGVLLAGAAYVPVDAQSPPERCRRIVTQVGAQLLLTQPHIDAQGDWPAGVTAISVSEDMLCAPVLRNPAEQRAPMTATSGSDLAYVLFTSGSTGAPKGVMIEHRGIACAVAATNERFGIGPGDRVLGLTALHHDISVYDLFGITAAGGAAVLPSPEETRDPARWVELIREHGVTVWSSVPAFMEMLLEYALTRPGLTLPSLRLVFLGGDFIALDLPERLRRVAPNARLVSVGGPTETTLWNIWYEVKRVDPAWKSIPYGRPLPGARYLVLDGSLEPCPIGVPGELCCSGIGLARGYWDDPALTAERFPALPSTGERIYRTGDLGRLLPTGDIEILGRTDFQVKILGYRIETAEVEAALLRHPAVRAAVVVGHGTRGRQRLAAYLVPHKGAALPAGDELRRHLAGLLPQPMIPTSYIEIERLPLSANGKVDRRTLREASPPDERAPAPMVAAAGADSVIAEVAAIAAELLGVPSLDPDTDLMARGVDSLTLVRLANQIESRFGFRPPAGELFRAPSVRSIAALLQTGATAPAPSPPTALGAAGMPKYQVITEPSERAAFRQKQLGIRPDADGARLDLPGAPEDGDLRSRCAARRSHRRFALSLIPRESLGRLLGSLRRFDVAGSPKYLYPSGGGLYGVQLYVHVKRGRVEDTPGGVYYYHPVRHQLVTLAADAKIDREIHVPFINQPIFDEAALSLFFVAQLDAIGPLYGDYSVHNATLEAGIMSQVLDAAAPPLGIGLCHIGHIEFDRIRPLFQLDASHVLIHSMVGGHAEEAQRTAADAKLPVTRAERAERLREQVRRLSPEEVRKLLATMKSGAGERKEAGANGRKSSGGDA